MAEHDGLVGDYAERGHAHRSAARIDLPPPSTAPRSNESFTVGVGLLLLVVLLWTGSNFLTNYQLTSGYDKPFAVTYLNTSSFSLYLVPFALALRRGRRRKRDERRAGSHTTSREGASSDQPSDFWARLGFHLPQGSLWRTEGGNADAAYSRLATSEVAVDSEHNRHSRGRRPAGQTETFNRGEALRPSSIDGRRPRIDTRMSHGAAQGEAPVLAPLDLHQTASLAAQFMIVWFLANYSLNVALKLTSVASATTLSSASGFFTLALGAIVGVEAFTLSKLAAVTMSFVGVLLVTRADAQDGPGTAPIPGEGSREPAAPFAGDLLALASAGFYAMYVVLLKKRIVHESRVSMPLFFGFVGLFNVLAMWPVGLLLHLTRFEKVALPQGRNMWAGVLTNMAITVVSDMAYLIAMLKSSPLVATVGLSLTIPLAIAGDALRGSHSGGAQSYFGSAVVLTSFVAIGLADRASAA